MTTGKKARKKSALKSNSTKQKSISVPPSSTQSIGYLFLALVIVLTILAYIPLKDSGFVNYDDPGYVTKNPYVQSFSLENVKTTFLAGVHPDYPDGLANNYHPITMISLMCNHAMSALNAGGYHWTNLIFHLINVFLSYLFFMLLLGKDKRILAILGAAIFALHPMHVESVAWISERKDMLFMMFYLLGMNSYIEYRKDGKSSMALIYVFFVLSLLSKPAAVTFPIVLILLDYLLLEKLDWKNLLLKLPMIALSIIFGLITLNIQSDLAVGELDRFSFLEKFSLASYGLVHYLQQFLLPLKCAVFHPYPSAGKLSFFMQLAPVWVLGIVGMVVFLVRKNKWVVFSLLFFVVNLALTLQFIQVGASVVSNRYTYLPYHGLILLLLYLTSKFFFTKESKFYNSRKVILGALCLWLLLLSFKTFKQVKTWKNSETLWSNVLDVFPGSAYAYKGRGDYYKDENQLDKAIKDFQLAAKVYDKDHELLSVIGNIKRQQGKYNEALVDLNKSISLSPTSADAYNNRANVYMNLNKLDLAYSDYLKCLKIDDKHEESLINIGTYYFNKSNHVKAIESFTKAFSTYPTRTEILINRAAAYYYSKNYPAAITDIDKYLSVNKPLGQAYLIKSLALEDSGRYDEALAVIEQAIRLENSPQYVESKRRLMGLMGSGTE